MHRLYAARTERFGNGRQVRNTFQAATNRQELRLASKTGTLTTEELSSIIEADLCSAGDSPDFPDALPRRWRLACRHCQEVNEALTEQLGRAQSCTKCGKAFDFDWPEPA